MSVLSIVAPGLGSALVLTAGLMLFSSGSPQSEAEDLPREFQQVLPRGALRSIDQPRFVTSREAKISEDAWVFGVVVEGQARAYNLNLLNSHEVVNDQVGERAFAAVW